MHLSRNAIIALLVLPILLLAGWFIAEQLPGWLAPPPPWVRYPDLVALPGGCEAALTLANAGATRTNNPAQNDATAAAFDDVLEAQFPQVTAEILATPQSVRFSDGSDGWFSLIALPREDGQGLTRGAVVLMNRDGTLRDIIHLIGGDSTHGERCGDFAPQPQGLRAQLRPYLPLLLLVGYLLLIGISALGLRLVKRMRA